MECDPQATTCTSIVPLFQSKHSHGVRHDSLDTATMTLDISIHALTWSATSSLKEQQEYLDNFNPRTHMECDKTVQAILDLYEISIHALTWSATSLIGFMIADLIISIHALTWSATTFDTNIVIRFFISIHALTWSATISN